MEVLLALNSSLASLSASRCSRMTLPLPPPVSLYTCITREPLSPSLTSALLCHHVHVLLQHHRVVIGQEEHMQAAERAGHTRGPLDQVLGATERHIVHQTLHCRVVCGSLLLCQRELTATEAVEGVVAARRDHEVGPADLLEVDVELLPLAAGRDGGQIGVTAWSAGRGGADVPDQLLCRREMGRVRAGSEWYFWCHWAVHLT